MRLPIATTALALAACTAPAAAPATATPATPAAPRGVIVILGDGLGAAQVTLARQLRGDRFQLGRMPYTGLVTTASASSLATDSAAAATALATGVKTTNGFLGIAPDGSPRQTVVELAEARGLATGLVTTAKLGDASPAAFAVHHRDRMDLAEVRAQLVARGIDVLASGDLDTLGAPAVQALARAAGYTPVVDADGLRTAGAGPVLAVLRSGPLDADSPDASLRELAAWAIHRLGTDPDGMFLLVEHEGIDSAGHERDAAALATAVRRYDETVGAILDLALPRGLLVVALGDHETGGVQLGGTTAAPAITFATDRHTGEAVPVFAAGPGAEQFAGFHDNTEIGAALLATVGRLGSAGALPEPRGPQRAGD